MLIKAISLLRCNSKYLVIILILLAGCSADRQTKRWAASSLKGNPPVTIIKGFLEFGFAENRGMVFGLMNDRDTSIFKTILTLARVLILIGFSGFIFLKRMSPLPYLVPFVLIVAGAWGNVFDGLRHGYVIDFIHLRLGSLFDWPFLFNVADVWLCIGMGILILKEITIRWRIITPNQGATP